MMLLPTCLHIERLLFEALTLRGVFGWQLSAAFLLDNVCEFVRKEATLVIGRQRSSAGKVNVASMGEGIRLEIPRALLLTASPRTTDAVAGTPRWLPRLLL